MRYSLIVQKIASPHELRFQSIPISSAHLIDLIDDRDVRLLNESLYSMKNVYFRQKSPICLTLRLGN